MKPDWIPNWIWNGRAEVICKTCGECAEFNANSRVYECGCPLGATAEALALGLPGYSATYEGETQQ